MFTDVIIESNHRVKNASTADNNCYPRRELLQNEAKREVHESDKFARDATQVSTWQTAVPWKLYIDPDNDDLTPWTRHNFNRQSCFVHDICSEFCSELDNEDFLCHPICRPLVRKLPPWQCNKTDRPAGRLAPLPGRRVPFTFSLRGSTIHLCNGQPSISLYIYIGLMLSLVPSSVGRSLCARTDILLPWQRSKNLITPLLELL